jgi:isopropylmalate/homocitrate/citramalate synthase
MLLLYKQVNLANGLELLIYDQSRRYFGDYNHVKLEIRCTVNIPDTVGTAQLNTEETRKFLGDEVVYRRFLEKMGVPSIEVGLVKKKLVADFCEHSLSYLASPAFPGKLVAAELRRAQKRMPRASV